MTPNYLKMEENSFVSNSNTMCFLELLKSLVQTQYKSYYERKS